VTASEIALTSALGTNRRPCAHGRIAHQTLRQERQKRNGAEQGDAVSRARDKTRGEIPVLESDRSTILSGLPQPRIRKAAPENRQITVNTWIKRESNQSRVGP